MKIISKISENEFILHFLKSEITSNRWGEKLRNLLAEDNRVESVISNPDLQSADENTYRKNLLATFRGYRVGEDLFEGFPMDTKWYRCVLNREEIQSVKYINYSYWNKLSKNTRLPSVGADEVRKGTIVFDQPNTNIIEASEALTSGKHFPEMIFVGKSETDQLVILEGHVRMTAYFLVPKSIPAEIEVILGFSKNIAHWDLY